MDKPTKEQLDIDQLVRNRLGFLTLGTLIVLCLGTDASILILNYLQGKLWHPFMGAALIIHISVLIIAALSLTNRHIFYAPLMMSVITAGSAAVLMLGIWLAFATTISSVVAPWLHPYQRPTKDLDCPKGDLVMSEIDTATA